MDFTVYILFSTKYGKYYIGQTADLKQRLIAHNKTSEGSFTSKFRPWSLMITIEVESRSIAMKIEKYLKKKDRAFIKRVIDEKELRIYIFNKFSSAG